MRRANSGVFGLCKDCGLPNNPKLVKRYPDNRELWQCDQCGAKRVWDPKVDEELLVSAK
jgi:ribosomal protein L37AE/L43A